MGVDTSNNLDVEAASFVPKTAYIDPEYAKLERARLWPKVWQVACREEELASIGDYVEYTVLDESIIVVRTAPDEIRAHFNTCQHRGRQLVDGVGQVQHFRCPFHGWRYELDGTLSEVTDRGDFRGCDLKLDLQSCQVDTWGGFVFVHMDPANTTPLAAFLDPVPQYLDPFELGAMRFRWYKTVVFKCNWKTALDAFNEGYHFSATHPQLLPVMDERTTSVPMGDHAMFRNADDNEGLGVPSPRLAQRKFEDPRVLVSRYMQIMEDEVDAMWSPSAFEATRQRLLAEVPEGTDAMTVLGALIGFHQQSAEAEGAGWPDITFEQMAAAGWDWHVFPNLVLLPQPTGMLMYRARPAGPDPDRCLFDVWSLVRFAPGSEPPIERVWIEDWKEHDGWGRIFRQDWANIEAVQRGLHSQGFAGLRTNPVKESAIPNYHRVLRRYLHDGE